MNNELKTMAKFTQISLRSMYFSDKSEFSAIDRGLDVILETDFELDIILAHVKGPRDIDGLLEWAKILGSKV